MDLNEFLMEFKKKLEEIKGYEELKSRIPRSCLRCEERRTQADFANDFPICNECLTTMPPQELQELRLFYIKRSTQ
jgi:hypothetical protein